MIRRLIVACALMLLLPSVSFSATLHIPRTPGEVGAEPANSNIQAHISATGNVHSLSLANIVSIIQTAVPRNVWMVYGDSSDGGTTPDTTTQNNINTLIAAGVPSANIRWLYVVNADTFVVNNMTSASGIDGNITLVLSHGVFSIADMTSASGIDGDWVITQEGLNVFVVDPMTSASGIDGNIVLVLSHDVFAMADMTSASGIDGNLSLTQSGGTFALADMTSASGIDNVTITQEGGGSTTVNIYGSTADGSVDNEGYDTWANIRGATTGTAHWTDDESPQTYADNYHYDSGYSQITRAFQYFNLGAIIPGGKTITAAVWHAYRRSSSDTGGSAASLQKGTQSDTLADSDFDSFSGSEYGHTGTGVGWITVTLNSTGLADLNAAIAGVAKICIREYSHDYLNVDPAPSAFRVDFYTQDYATDTSKRPYLEVTYE